MHASNGTWCTLLWLIRVRVVRQICFEDRRQCQIGRRLRDAASNTRKSPRSLSIPVRLRDSTLRTASWAIASTFFQLHQFVCQQSQRRPPSASFRSIVAGNRGESALSLPPSFGGCLRRGFSARACCSPNKVLLSGHRHHSLAHAQRAGDLPVGLASVLCLSSAKKENACPVYHPRFLARALMNQRLKPLSILQAQENPIALPSHTVPLQGSSMFRTIQL